MSAAGLMRGDRAPISICMIVRNEEPRIRRCLESVRPFVEQIIVLDTGSTDRTIDVAGELADRVEQDTSLLDEHGCLRDFAEARNRSEALASSLPWRMWLDADELVVKGQTLAAVVATMERERERTGVIHLGTLVRYTRGEVGDRSHHYGRHPHCDWQTRLLPTGCGFRWKRAVHEIPWSRPSDRTEPYVDARFESPHIFHAVEPKPRWEHYLRILLRLVDEGRAEPDDENVIGDHYFRLGDLEASDLWYGRCVLRTGTEWHLRGLMGMYRNAISRCDARTAIRLARQTASEFPTEPVGFYAIAKIAPSAEARAALAIAQRLDPTGARDFDPAEGC